MLRVAICEDVLSELQKQTQIIQSIMARLSKNVKFFCFRSGEELLMETDTTGNMDIVFLDVEMLGISGIETARILRERDSRVILIFVSCHNQYCKEMIEVQPYAFIDKPVSEEKLEKILKRVFETHLNSDDSYCFSYNKRQYNIPLNQIRFFQSDKRIVQINAVQLDMPELEYLFYGKLEEVERNLRKANVKFLRIRKSLLVNTRFIKEYSADRVVLDNGREVEISKNYRDHVRQHYISMLKGRRWECVEIFSVILQRIFCDSTLKKKKIRRYTDYLVWGGYFAVFNGVTYVLTYLGDGTSNIWLNILLFVCIFFVTIRILYTDSVRTLMATTIFMYMSGMCAELLVYYGKEFLAWTDDAEVTLLCTVLSKIVWYLIIKFTSLIIKLNRKAELNLQDWLEVFIVPVCSIWILISVFITGTLENYFWGFIVVFMILLINVFTYYLYDKAKENMEKQMREEILKNQCEYYIRQNRESKEWWEELRKLRHNMKQHYILENTYLEKEDYEALKRYCSENLKFLDKKDFISNSGNLYIDSVVNYKADMAEKAGIKVIANTEVPQDAEMNAEDISICLGNLLDNAIEAVKELTEDRVIRLWITTDGNNIAISIKNRYKNALHKSGGRYLTSKEDDRMHGIGLSIVRQIVDQYAGEMEIREEDNVFDVMILMYDFLT